MKEKLQEILQTAKTNLLADGYVLPVAFIFVGKETYVLPLRLAKPGDRDICMMMMAHVIRDRKADYAAMVVESYVGKPVDKAGIDRLTRGNIRVSELPDRVEAVTIMGIGRNPSEDILAYAAFKKDEQGKIIFADDEINVGADMIGGFFGDGFREAFNRTGN